MAKDILEERLRWVLPIATKEVSLVEVVKVFPYGKRTLEGNLANLQDKRFDLIITAGVLEYTPLKKTIANVSRFLVLGGYYFNSPIRTTRSLIDGMKG